MTIAKAPQQDRSRATRRRLLAAAIDSLSELGWTSTTVAVVAERAGVSRGAAQHHFPTREDLFTAAIEYMADVRMSEIRREVGDLPEGSDRTAEVVGMIVGIYSGPLFRAALQIWVAAASNEALRSQIVPLEAKLGASAHRAASELLGVDESVPGAREAVQATLDLARGLALADVLTDDSRRRRRVVGQWSAMLRRELDRLP